MVNISQFWGPTKNKSFISGQRWFERGLLIHNHHTMSGYKQILLSYNWTLLKPLKRPNFIKWLRVRGKCDVAWRIRNAAHYSLSIIGTGPPTPSPPSLADISDISIFGDKHIRALDTSLIMKECSWGCHSHTARLAQVVSENVLLNLSI